MIVTYLQKCKSSFCNGRGCTQMNFYCKFAGQKSVNFYLLGYCNGQGLRRSGVCARRQHRMFLKQITSTWKRNPMPRIRPVKQPHFDRIPKPTVVLSHKKIKKPLHFLWLSSHCLPSPPPVATINAAMARLVQSLYFQVRILLICRVQAIAAVFVHCTADSLAVVLSWTVDCPFVSSPPMKSEIILPSQ